jgi:hypothetical protein
VVLSQRLVVFWPYLNLDRKFLISLDQRLLSSLETSLERPTILEKRVRKPSKKVQKRARKTVKNKKRVQIYQRDINMTPMVSCIMKKDNLFHKKNKEELKIQA